MKQKLQLKWAAGVLGMMFASVSFAGGFNCPDVGPRRTGMFAITARPDDTTALMHNVAGLASQKGDRILVTGTAFFMKLKMKLHCEPWMTPYDNQGECSGGNSYSPEFSPESTYGLAPFLGASFDLSPMLENLVAGISVSAPNFVGAFLGDKRLSRFFGIESYFLTVLTTGAVAYRPWPFLAVGLGVSDVYVSYQSKKSMDLLDEFTLKINGSDSKPMMHLGLLMDPWSWLSVGLAFDSQVDLSVEGPVDIYYPRTDPNKSIFHFRQQTHLMIPWQLKMGINVHPNDWLEVGLDYKLFHYSAFAKQTTKAVFDDNEQSPLRGIIQSANFDQIHNYHEAHNLALGARFRLPWERFPMWAMCGIQYDWSPAQKEYLTLDAPFNDQYGFALGVEARPSDWLGVGLGFIRNWFVDMNITNSKTNPPSNAQAQTNNFGISLSLEFIL